MQLENITLRIPAELRKLIEDAAEKAGTTNADEIRLALSTYYKIPQIKPVTLADLEARISVHEATMHSPQQNVIENIQVPTAQELANERRKAKELEAEASKSRAEAQERANKISCLRQLSKMFDEGLQPTPSEIGSAIGLSPLIVGRLLTSVGVRATNTRINNLSARYYLMKLKPKVMQLCLEFNGTQE